MGPVSYTLAILKIVPYLLTGGTRLQKNCKLVDTSWYSRLRNEKCSSDRLHSKDSFRHRPSLRVSFLGGKIEALSAYQTIVGGYDLNHGHLVFDSVAASSDLIPFHRYRPLAMSTIVQKLKESFEQICCLEALPSAPTVWESSLCCSSDSWTRLNTSFFE